MGETIRLPGPVYIEECGLLPCRGDMPRLEPARRERIEVWPPGKRCDRPSHRVLLGPASWPCRRRQRMSVWLGGS